MNKQLAIEPDKALQMVFFTISSRHDEVTSNDRRLVSTLFETVLVICILTESVLTLCHAPLFERGGIMSALTGTRPHVAQPADDANTGTAGKALLPKVS